MEASDAERRLLYAALTRARRALQIFSSFEASPVFDELRSPQLERREVQMAVADELADHEYGLIDRKHIWLDWLGRKPPEHPGHDAWRQARPGDSFTAKRHRGFVHLVDAHGREMAALSVAGAETWTPRMDRGLRVKLLAVVHEREDDPWREASFREGLRVPSWCTGVWECRWRSIDVA